MCFIAVLFQVHPDYPLVVAANRNERRDRPATGPHRWAGEPTIWAGRDILAGGTWLGVNEAGLLVAVTNRGRPTDRSLPSRGVLCLDALRQSSPSAALVVAQDRLRASPYNPFNLLGASPSQAWVTTWKGDTRFLSPGFHVITNHGDVDDPKLPTVARATSIMVGMSLLTAPLEVLLADLGRVCADTTEPAPICRPGGTTGTVSSSIIALAADGSVRAYRHADGPPNHRPYVDVMDASFTH